MLIDDSLLHFCAKKTAEITDLYKKGCGSAEDAAAFPRSADDLSLVVQGHSGLEIFHGKLSIHHTKAKYRSFYIPEDKSCKIWYADGLPTDYLRYYKSKELLQIQLWQESLATVDIVDLVQNMILKASPGSLELNLGHAATSDTLGEIAAMEFLFPFEERIKHVHTVNQTNGFKGLGVLYGVPPFAIQRCFNTMNTLKEFFTPR
jgi:hypothetical protein